MEKVATDRLHRVIGATTRMKVGDVFINGFFFARCCIGDRETEEKRFDRTVDGECINYNTSNFYCVVCIPLPIDNAMEILSVGAQILFKDKYIFCKITKDKIICVTNDVFSVNITDLVKKENPDFYVFTEKNFKDSDDYNHQDDLLLIPYVDYYSTFFILSTKISHVTKKEIILENNLDSYGSNILTLIYSNNTEQKIIQTKESINIPGNKHKYLTDINIKEINTISTRIVGFTVRDFIFNKINTKITKKIIDVVRCQHTNKYLTNRNISSYHKLKINTDELTTNSMFTYISKCKDFTKNELLLDLRNQNLTSNKLRKIFDNIINLKNLTTINFKMIDIRNNNLTFDFEDYSRIFNNIPDIKIIFDEPITSHHNFYTIKNK